jgi:hypothetical protein
MTRTRTVTRVGAGYRKLQAPPTSPKCCARVSALLLILSVVVVGVLLAVAYAVRFFPFAASSSSTTPPSTPGPQAVLPTLVLVAAGQSNMVGASQDGVPFGAGTPFSSPYTTQLSTNFTIVPAVDPLDWPAYSGGHSQAITAAYSMWRRTGQNVTIIPCASGGTGFTTTPNWTPVNMSAGPPPQYSLYYDCTNRTNYVLSLPGHELAGILWDQGETEAFDNLSGASWLALVDNLVASWRRDITNASTAPFVSVQMVPLYVATAGYTFVAIQAAIDSIPFNISRSAVVYAYNSSGSPLLAGDGGTIHFSAAAQQALGFLDDPALVAASFNRPGATLPGQVLQVFVSPPNVSWTPDPVAASYQLWCNSAQRVVQPGATSLVLSGLSPCTAYVLNVTAVGPSGLLGQPSAQSAFLTAGCP